MKVENDLNTDQIRKLVWSLAIPSMLAQFVNVLYSIVDRMYIGNIPEIGEAALAGAGVCGPIVTLISSFASWVGVGGAPLMSIRMGQGKPVAARRILANCFVMLCAMSCVMMAVFFLLKDRLLVLFGASPAIFPYADEYLSWYLTGTVFALLSTGMSQFIICQGFAKTAMAGVMIGAVSNIILDPVFIFVLGMGVKGAAIATVLSQLASCAFVLHFLRGSRPPTHITFGGYSRRVIRQVLTVGLSPFLIIASDSVLIILMNALIQKYGGQARGDMLLTCNTIVQSFMLMITMPLGGITGGTQTILGYNYGAGRPDRIRRAEKNIALFGVVFTTIMFLAARFLPHVFAGIFTRDPEYTRVTVWAIRIYTLCVIPLAIQYTVVDGFTGMGIAKVAVSLSMFRKTVYLAAMLIFPALWGAEAIFYSEPFSDGIAALTSFSVYLTISGKILGDGKRL